MITIRIYRVENEYGLGPFHDNLWSKLWLYGHDIERAWRENHKRFSGFRDDFGPLSTEYISGCLSRVDIIDWFGEFTDILKREGFCIVEYESSDYLLSESGKQVAFNRESAHRVYVDKN